MTLSAIIVDDEPHARQALERMLGECLHIAVIDRCENGLAAVKAVHKMQPDVLFLDIQMPKLDGFDVLELLGEAADDYVVIHTEQQKLIKQERLNKLETRLDPRQFCRIHRSAIINLDYLAGIETETKDSRLANLKNGMQLAISRTGYSKLVQLL
ncbi:LytR/AlgR family response regulator transcription factor [Teredinibacter turnerae]|uniref:LytR/AlgR family response regulator transcription factor n=1 Tax=Teredinibacter turnerae TaxID=2426 RepID=UPI0003657558|nr:response regulator transcription factor [Teredinibacter turnerae]